MKENLIDIEPKHLAILKKILKQYVPSKTVWAYGSRVTWTAGAKSDLDIVVFEADSKQINDLKDEFAESDLPFSVDVMDWGKIPEKFKENIREKYVVLQEKVGLEGWRECKLGDLIKDNLADLQTGPFGTMLKASEYTSKGTPMIAVQDIGENKLHHEKVNYVPQSVAERLSRYKVKINDIIFGRKGAVDRRAIITKNEEGWIQGSDCIRLRFNDDIDARFISYQLGSVRIKDWLIQHSHGATMPSLNQEILSLLPLSLPSLIEQNAISSVLSSFDDKIDLLHKENKTLEAMAETLFRQWFVEDEEIRTIQLGNIIEIHDSKRIPLSSTQRDKMKSGTLYPYYGAATIMDYINDFIFDGEYLLLGEDGTVQTDVGFPILQMAVGKYWVNNHTHVLNAKEPYTNFILYSILKKTSVSHIVTGAVQPKINQENLKSLEIEVPSEEKIKLTVSSTNNIWEKIQFNNKHINLLKQLRDTLLPKLMSGEVRVEV